MTDIKAVVKFYSASTYLCTESMVIGMADTTVAEAIEHFEAWANGTADFFYNRSHGPVMYVKLIDGDNNVLGEIDRTELIADSCEAWTAYLEELDREGIDELDDNLDVANIMAHTSYTPKKRIPTYTADGMFFCYYDSIEDIVQGERRFDWMNPGVTTDVRVYEDRVVATYPSGKTNTIYLVKPIVKNN